MKRNILMTNGPKGAIEAKGPPEMPPGEVIEDVQEVIEETIPPLPDEPPPEPQTPAPAPKRGRGRPAGSKNKPKTASKIPAPKRATSPSKTSDNSDEDDQFDAVGQELAGDDTV
jgi:hypothetical protein